jgi:tetratricopeptide (TPR) repeat protein
LLAVAGRSLERVELARLGVPDLVTAEQAATDAGLLMRVSGRLGYRHALLREAVYAELNNAADLHDRVADALEPTDRAEVARHLALAGRPAEAACEWQAAALYARSVGALSEALGFLDLAAQAAPQQGEIWLDRQEVLAWMGRREDMEQAWAHALTLLPDSDLPAAWCRRGRQFRTVVCHPTASFEAYATAESLLTDSTPRDVRAQVLIGLAWGHAVAGDATLVDDLLARSAQDLPDRPDPVTASDIGEIRIHGLIRQGRFAECGAFALSWAAEFPAAMRADRIFAVWINAACALACVGDYEQALEFADRAVAGTMGTPVLLISCLAARAHLLARMGRHAEATDTARQQRDLAERLDSPLPAAIAAHDAGLVALAAGRYAEAAELLGQALDSGAPISRPAASLARAEALARAGNPDSAEHQLRAAALEPIGPADQPWALVPRMATIQGLIAAARDNPTLAAARFAEAERGWRALLPVVTDKTTEGFFANLVDLGRPPVVGLVEPGREIALLERERAMLSREMI